MGLSKDLQEARHLMEGLGECHNVLVAEQTAGVPGGTSGEEPTYQPETQDPWVRKIPLEEKIATHSSVSAWRAPWTEEPGELQSTGSQSRT